MITCGGTSDVRNENDCLRNLVSGRNFPILLGQAFGIDAIYAGAYSTTAVTCFPNLLGRIHNDDVHDRRVAWAPLPPLRGIFSVFSPLRRSPPGSNTCGMPAVNVTHQRLSDNQCESQSVKN